MIASAFIIFTRLQEYSVSSLVASCGFPWRPMTERGSRITGIQEFSGTMSNKSKEFSWVTNDPPFHHMLRASGQAEVWCDFNDEAKFRQYGWRCSTNEDSYSNATLIGNWSEERFDTRRTLALRRPLPHQFSHYFETTYYSSYKKDDIQPVYTTPKRKSRSFPGHQPELDPPQTKCVPNSCYRLDFKGLQHREEIVGETSEPQCGNVAETN